MKTGILGQAATFLVMRTLISLRWYGFDEEL